MSSLAEAPAFSAILQPNDPVLAGISPAMHGFAMLPVTGAPVCDEAFGSVRAGVSAGAQLFGTVNAQERSQVATLRDLMANGSRRHSFVDRLLGLSNQCLRILRRGRTPDPGDLAVVNQALSALFAKLPETACPGQVTRPRTAACVPATPPWRGNIEAWFSSCVIHDPNAPDVFLQTNLKFLVPLTVDQERVSHTHLMNQGRIIAHALAGRGTPDETERLLSMSGQYELSHFPRSNRLTFSGSCGVSLGETLPPSCSRQAYFSWQGGGIRRYASRGELPRGYSRNPHNFVYDFETPEALARMTRELTNCAETGTGGDAPHGSGVSHAPNARE